MSQRSQIAFVKKKSRIRETKHLSTDTDSSTNAIGGWTKNTPKPEFFEKRKKRLFAPTSQSRMSNIFRDSESLGKSNGKKWSNIWTFLFGNGLKLLRKKKFFVVVDFALQNMVETTLSDGLETSGRRGYC